MLVLELVSATSPEDVLVNRFFFSSRMEMSEECLELLLQGSLWKDRDAQGHVVYRVVVGENIALQLDPAGDERLQGILEAAVRSKA